MKLLIITLTLTLLMPSTALMSKPKMGIKRIKYFNKIYGHLHRNPSKYSESLTTISCGHPIKILQNSNEGWIKVKAGSYQGHILNDFLSIKKPICFQDRYPKFFREFNFNLSELYYWGRLFDQYVTGKSTVK